MEDKTDSICIKPAETDEDNKDVEKMFKVPKIIYDFVSIGDKALVVRYKGKANKDSLSSLDFLPSTDP